MKSMFDEVDNRAVPSVKNATPSTAEECLAGCEENIQVAAIDRNTAYRRMTEWDVDQRKIQAQQLERSLFEQRRKRRDLNEEERTVLDEYLVLESDRQRAEAEIAHWREMAEWWRQRVALGLNKRYGASSVSDLVRSLADSKGAP